MSPRTNNKNRHTDTRLTSSEVPQAVRVWLLGGLRVSVGSKTIEEGAWRLRKAAALVKLLALAPGHRLHREQVISLLWPNLGGRLLTTSGRRSMVLAGSSIRTKGRRPATWRC